MLVKYVKSALNAHLECGLLEDINLTDEQKDELALISDLVEGIKKEYLIFLRKYKVENIKDLLEKAKTDKKLEDSIKKWMDGIYSRKNKTIQKAVDNFNIKHNESYAKYMKSLSNEKK